MSDRISVREWRDNFNNGVYSSSDTDTQIDAGWYDWFCGDYELISGTRELGEIVNMITDDYILDNYYVWLKNCCPASDDPLYNEYMFDPLNDDMRSDRSFGVISHDNREEYDYVVFTARNDYKNEAGTDYFYDLGDIINNLWC